MSTRKTEDGGRRWSLCVRRGGRCALIHRLVVNKIQETVPVIVCILSLKLARTTSRIH